MRKTFLRGLGTFAPLGDIVHMRTQAWSSGEPSSASLKGASAPTGSSAPKKAMGETELIWMMAMLMALQAFGIDAILPAMDDLALALDVPGNDRQYVIGVYLVTAGLGALVPGALADRRSA
ncbi:MAG: Bcr/CflA subfamily drug resistance transporter, partial [Pseudomonadota bacterium]